MKCVEAQKHIRPYLEDNLSDKELESFLAHVCSCPSCYEDLQIYMAVYTALDAEDDEHTDYDFEHGLDERLHASQTDLDRRISISRLRSFLILLAEAMLIFILITAVRSHLQQQAISLKFGYIDQNTVVEKESESEALSGSVLIEEITGAADSDSR